MLTDRPCWIDIQWDQEKSVTTDEYLIAGL